MTLTITFEGFLLAAVGGVGLAIFFNRWRVAEYALYGSVGRLDAQSLGLSVPYYDPLEHYNIVKNKWFGLKPPVPPAPDE